MGNTNLKALELLVRRKAKLFIDAEKAYWRAISGLRQEHLKLAGLLSLPYEQLLPENISSTVFGLSDGVAFVRHKSIAGLVGVSFRALPHVNLEEWGNTGLIVPLDQGDFSLAQAGVFSGIGSISLMNCSINDVVVPYAEISHLRYGETQNAPSVEQAILDFQLTLLGLQTQQPSSQGHHSSRERTLEDHQRIANRFKELLDRETMEEDLQKFLKEHPYVLHPSAEAIPKQKLGEDFVTDFVLVETTMQGPKYVLVEARPRASTLSVRCGSNVQHIHYLQGS
jgi:hypothetical protein